MIKRMDGLLPKLDDSVAVAATVFSHIRQHPNSTMPAIAEGVRVPLAHVSLAIRELKKAKMVKQTPYKALA